MQKLKRILTLTNFMKHITTERGRHLRDLFRDAIKHQDEDRAHEVIELTAREGYNWLAKMMEEEYHFNFVTEVDFDKALDDYVSWQYTR